MRIASVADIKANFSTYIKESEEGAVVVTRNGRPVAVLLGVQNDDEVERLILSPFAETAGHSRTARSSRSGRATGISHEDFWKQVDAEAAERREPEMPAAQGARAQAAKIVTGHGP